MYEQPEIEQEAIALQQLKDQICFHKIQIPSSALYAGDLNATLLRFLRSRKLNVTKTTALLKGERFR
jgi:hypothetical protein